MQDSLRARFRIVSKQSMTFCQPAPPRRQRCGEFSGTCLVPLVEGCREASEQAQAVLMIPTGSVMFST